MSREGLKIALCLAVAVTGCRTDTATPPAIPAPRTDVPLNVVVVDHPEIARTIQRLRGDWAARTGGSLAVEEWSTETLRNSLRSHETIEVDVLIYPGRYLAALVEQQQVQPLRNTIRQDEEVAFGQILPAIRDAELSYGGEDYAVPFASRLLAITSADRQVVEHTEPRQGVPEALPDGEYAAAWALLAQAAPMASHPARKAVLFDLEPLEPRITSAPFERALRDLVEAATSAQQSPSRPELQWAWWPATSATQDASPSPERANRVWLPQSDEVYNPDANMWESTVGGSNHVPLVGANSRIGSVASASRNAPAAFRLLAWLAGRSPDGGRATIARSEGASDPIQAALSQGPFLAAPRILEVDEYLTALDQSVRRARQGELTPGEALETAAAKWEEVTDRVGRERQREVYQKHLSGA